MVEEQIALGNIVRVPLDQPTEPPPSVNATPGWSLSSLRASLERHPATSAALNGESLGELTDAVLLHGYVHAMKVDAAVETFHPSPPYSTSGAHKNTEQGQIRGGALLAFARIRQELLRRGWTDDELQAEAESDLDM